MLFIISRNHSNTLLLINLQKTKLVQSKALQRRLFVLISGFHKLRARLRLCTQRARKWRYASTKIRAVIYLCKKK